MFWFWFQESYLLSKILFVHNFQAKMLNQLLAKKCVAAGGENWQSDLGYTTQEGIGEIKNNLQVCTTQEGIKKIKSNP